LRTPSILEVLRFLIYHSCSIHNTAIARKCGVEKVEILPAPRELDPRLLVWKGAYVLSKLESTNDMWIGEKEWNEVGVRCLRDRMLFVW
jgi:actin-related protein 8